MAKFIHRGLNMQMLKELKDIIDPNDGSKNPDYKREMPSEYEISASWYPKGWKDFEGKDRKLWFKVNTKKALNTLIEKVGGTDDEVDLSDRELDIIEHAYNTGVINLKTVRNMVWGVMVDGTKKVDEKTGETVFQFPEVMKYSQSEAKFIIDHIEKVDGKRNPNAFESEILMAFGKKGLSDKLIEAKRSVRNIKPIVHAPKNSAYPERRFFRNQTPEAGDKKLELDWNNLMNIKDVAPQIDDAIIPTKVGVLELEITATLADDKYLKHLKTAKDKSDAAREELEERIGVYRLENIDFKTTGEYRWRDVVEQSPEKSRDWKRQKKYVLSGHKDINPEFGTGRTRVGLEEGGQARFYRTQSVTIVSYIKRQMAKISRWMNR